MHARLTSGILGFTAFIFHFSAIAKSEKIHGSTALLSLIIGTGTFLVYHRGKTLALLSFLNSSKNDSGSILLIPAFAIVFLTPFFQSTFLLQSLPQMAISGLLTAAYYRPWRIRKRIVCGLRAVPLVKNLVLALAWGLATTPIMNGKGENIDLFWFRFLFVLALSIAIDVRDTASDSARGTRTLALLIGSRNSTTLASVLLLFAGGFAWFRLFPSDATTLNATIIPLHTIITAISVSLLNANSKPMTYFWLIDFQLFLHAFLFLITRISY